MVLPWHSYATSPAVLDHTVLPATRHKWTDGHGMIVGVCGMVCPCQLAAGPENVKCCLCSKRWGLWNDARYASETLYRGGGATQLGGSCCSATPDQLEQFADSRQVKMTCLLLVVNSLRFLLLCVTCLNAAGIVVVVVVVVVVAASSVAGQYLLCYKLPSCVSLYVRLPDCLFVRVFVCMCVCRVWFCSKIKLIPDEPSAYPCERDCVFQFWAQPVVQPVVCW